MLFQGKNKQTAGIAVVGGTPFDTKVGIDMLRDRGYHRCKGFPMARTAQGQHASQYGGPTRLMSEYNTLLHQLEYLQYSVVLLFCNSLAVAMGAQVSAASRRLRILTPWSIYHAMARRFSRPFVIAANAQCLAGIERLFQEYFQGRHIHGMHSLEFVAALERGVGPTTVFRQAQFASVVQMAEKQHCDGIILACTHLALLYAEFVRKAHLPVVEIGRELVAQLPRQHQI